jgi:hypothetical protein
MGVTMTLSREDIEKQALEEICSCRYYDLADNIEACSEEDLQAIIDHTVKCDICGD